MKVSISNWPEDKVEIFDVEVHPKREDMGTREIPFSGSLVIERDDFFDTGVNADIVPPKVSWKHYTDNSYLLSCLLIQIYWH